MNLSNGSITPESRDHVWALAIGLREQTGENAGTSGQLAHRVEAGQPMAGGDSIMALHGLNNILMDIASSIADSDTRRRAMVAANTLTTVAVAGLVSNAMETARLEMLDISRGATE